MPDAVDRDALAFAWVRATHLASPETVADELLAASAAPALRLNGVTALGARLRAAEILRKAGYRDSARNVLLGSADGAAVAQLNDASTLINAGDIAEAEAVVDGLSHWPVSDTSSLASITELLLCAANHGYFEQALRWAEAARTVAESPGQGIEGMPRDLNVRYLGVAAGVIRDLKRECVTDGADPAGQTAGPSQPVPELSLTRAQAEDEVPWPALVHGRLLWWPEPEYVRLIRQLPELRGVIGASWRDHTAKVQSSMVAFPDTQPSGRGQDLALAAADFTQYVMFLERTGADPRLPAVLTAFTSHAGSGYEAPANWPPTRRAPCWCGSGRRYVRCCGSADQ